MITIDMNKIRSSVPRRAVVNIKSDAPDSLFLEFVITNPSLPIPEREMCFVWLSQAIGPNNFSNFSIMDPLGYRFVIWLARKSFNFTNLSDDDDSNLKLIPTT